MRPKFQPNNTSDEVVNNHRFGGNDKNHDTFILDYGRSNRNAPRGGQVMIRAYARVDTWAMVIGWERNCS